MRDRSRRRWFENTVVYSLDVATFADGNGDGIGDFVGLIDRLDYLAGLGISTIWLLPFQRSPKRDYYIWRDRKPDPGGELMDPVFPGFEDDVWT